jgi:hypothetical protein
MIHEISHELVFSSWKVAYCTRPMNRVGYFFVWFDATDVNHISNGANTKTYSSICIDYLVLRPVAWERIMDKSRRRSQAGSKAHSRCTRRPSSNPDAVR